MISTEEAIAISDLFTNGNVSGSFTKDTRSAIIKIFEIAGVYSGNIIECPSCRECFDKTDDSMCPECGQECGDIHLIGLNVSLPCPDFDRGYNWPEGSTGTIVGVEEIRGIDHVIITTPDGRSWCVGVEEITLGEEKNDN